MKHQAPFFKTAFNHDTEEESNKHAIKEFGPSLTVQSMSEDADINILMQRYGVTGKMPDNPRIPQYIEFDEVFDFRTANEAVMRANEAFMEYPATLRGRFENDPQKFMEYCHDPANLEEMRTLGLAKPKEPDKLPPEPMLVKVVPDTPKG